VYLQVLQKLMRADQIWDILADGETGQTLAALIAEGADAGKIAGWCKGKAKGQAPNLAAVLDADALTAAFEAIKADPAAAASVQSLFTLLANAKKPQPAVTPAPTAAAS
jgi:hypothetical protein